MMGQPRIKLPAAEERHLRVAYGLLTALSLLRSVGEDLNREAVCAIADAAGFHLEKLYMAAGFDRDGGEA